MSELTKEIARLGQQYQFLSVSTREDAARRFRRHLDLRPLGPETVPLCDALDRVLAEPLIADVDVPGFDRSSVDGFAVRAADVADASQSAPSRLRVLPQILTPGVNPVVEVKPGEAVLIATGGMVPRGADAVVMVENTETFEAENGQIEIEVDAPVSPGRSIAWAGSDISRGEMALRPGVRLGSRELGIVAAIGLAEVPVCRRPRVAILSTGDEILAPGMPIRTGAVYDSNATIIAAAVAELGGEALSYGVVRDDADSLRARVAEALAAADMVILSGGTSKGAGDVCYQVVSEYDNPGILVHGVALKPGKPVCLAVTGGKPLVVLPGFPTSAIFTFHEFVAPVIRAFAGFAEDKAEHVPAVLPLQITSAPGRTEFKMVSLTEKPEGGFAAYPVPKDSGAVSSFSGADGFIVIEAGVDGLPAGSPVEVQIIGRTLRPSDLSVIGSHCVGLDVLAGALEGEGISTKLLNVGSNGGLAAAKRGECDIAPMHLLDAASDRYNEPFLTDDLMLVPGYRRMQGVVFRPGDARFEASDAKAAIATALADAGCLMVNRNAGSGTRILIDDLLAGARPRGYWSQPKSHNAVAAAVAQERADWGVAIETVAHSYGLGFLPLREEHYDFAIPRNRKDRPAVQRFIALLQQDAIRKELKELGFRFENVPGVS